MGSYRFYENGFNSCNVWVPKRKKCETHSENTVYTNTSSNSFGKPDVDVWIDRNNCAKSLIYMHEQNVVFEYVSV